MLVLGRGNSGLSGLGSLAGGRGSDLLLLVDVPNESEDKVGLLRRDTTEVGHEVGALFVASQAALCRSNQREHGVQR